MVFGATIHRFAIELSDLDPGVFETLDLRVARHLGESSYFLVAAKRVRKATSRADRVVIYAHKQADNGASAVGPIHRVSLGNRA